MPPHQQPSHVPVDRHAYIPPQVQQALTKQMQQAVPKGMQQYVAPFMELHLASPHMAAPVTSHPQASRTFAPHLPQQPAGVDLQHYHAAATPTYTSAAPAQPPRTPSVVQPQPPIRTGTSNSPQASYAATPNQSVSNQPAYDFILSPGQAAKTSALPRLPGSTNPLILRILVVAGGLVILLVAFTVLKGVLSGGSNNKPLLIGVAQSQQSIIHLSTGANLEKSLSLHNKNFATTAQLTLTSSQTDLVGYLGKTGTKKVSTKVLSLKTSAKTDEELTAAAAAGNYNPTFQAIMKTQFSQYQLALQEAYKKTPGTIGHKLLDDQYKQSQLLLVQLNDTTANP